MVLLSACTEYDIQPQKDQNQPGEPHVDTADTADTAVIDTADTADTYVDTGTITPPEKDDPVAVCSVDPNPVHPPFESATWYGEDSYDPEGGTITDFTWTLISQPSGSAVTMPTGSGPNRADFEPDLAGDYVGQLVVSTADGRTSEPCETTLESVPAEDLWVELYWDHASDDLDLHLIRPGGTLETDGDCYYLNCVPSSWGGGLDWGSSSSTADDPRLDLDDIPGTGPENINIDAPWSGYTGSYTVIVHDYAYSGQTYAGANNATVNIYLNGSLVWSDTRVITGEDTHTSFAEIDWSSGTVTSL